MVIWFETHATSEDNELQLASGWYDCALSLRGERQASELGTRRRGGGFATVYCSNLRRSYDTAALAFAGLNVPIVRDRRLRECDYGDMTRRRVSEVEARRLKSIDVPFPAGESYQEVTRRVAEWLCDASARHRDDRILVIGHRATFYALENLCRGLPLTDAIGTAWKWQPGWRYDMPVTR